MRVQKYIFKIKAKGLWIWPELIYIDKKPILVIDTEGIGSLEEH